MRQRFRVYLLTIGFALVLTSCDEGLKPSEVIPNGSFTGLITYRNWPPLDSLRDLRLVAFRIFPPSDITGEILQGRAFVYPARGDTALVPFFVDSLRYKVTMPAGRYEYVVVAQQFGPDVFKNWRTVGQYDVDTNLTVPSAIDVIADSVITNININVDFAHPPPPPFL